jgi:SAM-dependent methyltransferase
MARESREWLDRHWHAVAGCPGRVLDLGCGAGFDCEVLSGAGRTVVGLERSVPALKAARRRSPLAAFVRADLSRGLPFANASFGVAVASLSLHYLPWAATLGAMLEVRRVLWSDALLLLRVNANDDIEFGALDGEEVAHGLRRYRSGTQNETLKRFFSRQDVADLLVTGWSLEQVQHRTIDRYGRPKRVWEAVVRAT